MSVESVKLSPTSVSVGCYRRRIAFEDATPYYTDGNKLIKNGGEVIYTANSPIYDILTYNNKFLTIDAKGLVTFHSKENTLTNPINAYAGIFSGLEKTANNIIAAHDLSHTLRVIDPETLKTVNTFTSPGIPNGLSAYDNNIFVFTDDRTINVVDSRLDQIERSAVLSSQPKAIYCHDSMIIVACDDRRIRIYDSRRLKTSMATTKPASKNGTAALWTSDNKCIAAIGFDEGMTLVEPDQDVGQFKRCKFLSETPFVSTATVTDKGFAVLTRGGIMYNISDPVNFLRSQKEGGDEEADGE
ncbi:hypothetical protein TVAG_240480 [Trichomonas vaginalis G3]|uniref:Uncharacterized protein n=1 Tax=Trichomonas vaginalis (strain ATCC PRA-98 / G3) TaxID=412133 RepID=A2EJ95_TRIV3|nr:WD40 repeat-like family [Trichomonas vaginalis G3]EAY07247.1 hypothetical protein TVAG_240480 [Trichomonas vaginalis G3]KAI5528888.1 WD40 repeat-like family [Trichomonas vaginalis G3]|eukprot:XP_001319470.1 hypothetical protein [Trichomonas vaginalis G3]